MESCWNSTDWITAVCFMEDVLKAEFCIAIFLFMSVYKEIIIMFVSYGV